MNYIGIDGNVYSDELKHWKYIKKIKDGSGWRYFYTPEEIRAYQDKIDKDKIIKEKIDKDKIIKEKTFRYSPHDAYREQKRKREKEFEASQKPSLSKYKKELKDAARYAKPQTPDTMSRRVYRDKKKNENQYDKEWNRLYNEKKSLRKQLKKDGQIYNYETARKEADIKVGERVAYNKYASKKAKIDKRKTRADRYQKVTNKSINIVKQSKDKVAKGKSKVEKMLAPTSGGTQKSKTLSQTITDTKRNYNKPTVTKTENGILTSRTLKESVNGRTTVNRPYVPSEKEKKYIKKYKKKAKKDSSAGTHKQTTLKETIGAPKPRRGYR